MIPQNLAPVRIHARCVADFPTIQDHVRHCMGLGLKVFTPTETPHDLEAVLVGSGPSVKTQVNKLKSLRKKKNMVFFGIKGGHDFLLDNKIQPDFGVAVDPLEKIHKQNFLRKAEKCVYFIASQCHPTLFDTLVERGENVVIWHLLTNSLSDWAKDTSSPIYQHYMIPGGSTSGLRGIVLAYSMGFRKFHLFGYDSCLQGKRRKVNGEEMYEKEGPDGKPNIMKLTVGGKQFLCDPAFASQANEFQDLMKSLWKADDPYTIKPYGEGLIQQICRERYREGAAEIVL